MRVICVRAQKHRCSPSPCTRLFEDALRYVHNGWLTMSPATNAARTTDVTVPAGSLSVIMHWVVPGHAPSPPSKTRAEYSATSTQYSITPQVMTEYEWVSGSFNDPVIGRTMQIPSIEYRLVVKKSTTLSAETSCPVGIGWSDLWFDGV